MEINKNLCTHRKDNNAELEIIKDEKVRCKICGAEFNFINRFDHRMTGTDPETLLVIDTYKHIYDALQTLKVIYVNEKEHDNRLIAKLLEKDKYTVSDLAVIYNLFNDAIVSNNLTYNDFDLSKIIPKPDLKVKIIINDKYNFEGKEPYMDYTGRIISSSMNDLSYIRYCKNIGELYKLVKEGEFILFLEDDTETPIMYNKSMIRMIIPIHTQIK